MLGNDARLPPFAMTATITDFIAHHAVLAVFVVMAIDSLLPVGGELTMLFAGAVASGAIAGSHVGLLGADVASGLPAYLVLVVTGTLGYLVGSWIGWLIASLAPSAGSTATARRRCSSAG
jgi:hypothetical protein